MSGKETNALQPHCSFFLKDVCCGFNKTSCTDMSDKNAFLFLNLILKNFLQLSGNLFLALKKGVLIRFGVRLSGFNLARRLT